MKKQKERTPVGARSFFMGKNRAKFCVVVGLSRGISAGDALQYKHCPEYLRVDKRANPGVGKAPVYLLQRIVRHGVYADRFSLRQKISCRSERKAYSIQKGSSHGAKKRDGCLKIYL